MNGDRRKQFMVGVIVACVVAAAGITFWIHRGRSSTPGAKRQIYVLCANPDCGKSFEMTAKEFREIMQAQSPERMAPMMGPMGLGQMAFTCKSCGEESVYLAQKCERCGKVFIVDYTAKDRFPDRCLECGYSEIEQRKQAQKK